MSSTPFVSVIVPAYNAAWCVGETLSSIAAQTYPNFEVIVVNDGSTDETLEVIRPYAEKDARFRVVSQENRGLTGARNRGIDESKGELIAPLDADDLWHPQFLQKMVDALMASAPETPFVYCYSLWIDDAGFVFPFYPPQKPPRADFIGLLHNFSPGNGSCSLFRKSSLLRVGGYDRTLLPRGARTGEDWKLALQLTAVAPAIVLPEFLVGYRLSERSLSAVPDKQTQSLLIVLDDIRKEFPKVAPHHFWIARTDFLTWLLPRWASKGAMSDVIRYACLAYLGNPFWMLNPRARRLALEPARSLVRRLVPRLKRKTGAVRVGSVRELLLMSAGG